MNVRKRNTIIHASMIPKNYSLKKIKKTQKILQRKVGHARTPNDTVAIQVTHASNCLEKKKRGRN